MKLIRTSWHTINELETTANFGDARLTVFADSREIPRVRTPDFANVIINRNGTSP
jgi:hypothetical protein